MTDNNMTPDRALEIVLGQIEEWLPEYTTQSNPYIETVQAVKVLRETLREASDDVSGTLSDDAKALEEATDVPNFFEFRNRAELIRNRCAFLYGDGDEAIGADWRDLSLGELVDKYGWVLKLDADTEAAIDWPEDCNFFNQPGIEYDSAMLDPESEK